MKKLQNHRRANVAFRCGFLRLATVSRASPGLATKFHAISAVGRLLPVIVCLAIAFPVQGCLSGAKREKPEPSRWEAARMPAWDKAFQSADPRWKGADSASSVPLSSTRNLWLFGDTWITKAEPSGRKGGKIVRNSLAVQQTMNSGPGTVRFFWQQKQGRPRAAFLPASEPGWLWPLSGIRLEQALYLFFLWIAEADNDLGFQLRGAVLLAIPNPDRPPHAWTPTYHEVPFFLHGEQGDMFFGLSCLSSQEFVYIYGAKEDWTQGAEGRTLLVARSPVEAFQEVDFTSWQFHSEDGWTAKVERAAPLFNGAATEMSVARFPALNRFMAVYTYCGLAREILARTAPAPEGPWGEPSLLWQCPEAEKNRDYFCYAGKAHPELARSAEELIVTYATNSWVHEDHFDDLDLYWPRFVKMIMKHP